MICLYLKKWFKKLNDLNKGLEIYLYKYRSSNVQSLAEWRKVKLNLDRTKRAWIEHFYDKDKIQEVFGSAGSDALISKRDPDWWRYHTHLTKEKPLNQSKHLLYWSYILMWYFVVDWWSIYRHLYRNSKWIWDFYRMKQEEYELLIKNNQYVAKGYHDRIWFDDGFSRVESGDTLFCKWYEDFYRKLRHLPVRELDYGNVGPGKDIEFITYYKGWEQRDHNIHYITGFGDGYWVHLSRAIETRLYQEKQKVYNIMIKGFNDFYKKILRMHVVDNKRHHIKNKDILTTLDVSEYLKFIYNLEGKVRGWRAQYYEGYGFYYKEIFEISQRNIKNINAFHYMKGDIKTKMAEKKEDLLIWKLGELYEVYNPGNKDYHWLQFVQWVKDEIGGYDIKEINNLHSNILIKLQETIYPLLWKDIQRYGSKKDSFIFGDYYDKFLKQKKEIYIKHKECFETGKILDIKSLLEVTENEKHYHNFCYHIVKYKLERIIILKEPDLVLQNPKKVYKIYNSLVKHYKELLQEQYFGSWYYPIIKRLQYTTKKINEGIIYLNKHSPREFPKWKRIPKINYEHFQLEQEKVKVGTYLSYLEKLLLKHEKRLKVYGIDDMLVKYLRKKGRYIKNINQEIPKSEIIDYKIKLLISFVKEKTNFWIFIENFSMKLDIIELLMILVKLILKILG